MSALIIGAYAVVALLTMPVIYRYLSGGWNTRHDDDKLAVILGAVWPITVTYGLLVLIGEGLAWFARWGSR